MFVNQLNPALCVCTPTVLFATGKYCARLAEVTGSPHTSTRWRCHGLVGDFGAEERFMNAFQRNDPRSLGHQPFATPQVTSTVSRKG